MILKLCGAAFVLAASALAGLYYGSFVAYRTNDLQEMKKALAILRAEIAFSMTPLPEAFANIGARTQQPVAGIFLAAAERLTLNRSGLFEDIWRDILLNASRGAYFDKEDIAAFLSFGRTLGYLDKDMQTAGIMAAVGYIDSAIAALAETRAKNKKLFGSLGVLGGLLTVIVLL